MTEPGPSTVTSKELIFPLASLPQDCLHFVLSQLSPRDIGRFACVNTAWKAAASVAWSRTAPWLRPAASGFPNLRDAESPAAAYSAVLKGVSSEDSELLSVDASTGLLSLHVPVLSSDIDLLLILSEEASEHVHFPELILGLFSSDSDFYIYMDKQINLPVAEFSHGEPHVPTFGLPPGRYEVFLKATRNPRIEWTDGLLKVVLEPEGTVLKIETDIDPRAPGQPFHSRFPGLAEVSGINNPTSTDGEVAEEGSGDQMHQEDSDDRVAGNAGLELYLLGEIDVLAGNQGTFRVEISLFGRVQGTWLPGSFFDSLIFSQLA